MEDTFDLRKYLSEGQLYKSPLIILSEALIREGEEGDVSKEDIKKGIEGVSKLLKINPNELASSLNKIQKAEKEGDKEEIKKVQQTLSKKLEENLDEAIGITAAIAIASLIPTILEATGRGVNALKRELPGWLDKETQVQAKAAYNKIKSKKEELKKLKQKINTFSDIAKSPPGPTTKPKYVEAYNKYKEVAKNFNILKKEIKKLAKKYDEEYGTRVGNWMKKAGHKLHEWYVAPFNGILWVLGYTGLWPQMRNKKLRKKAANIFYSLSMISLAGFGVVSHLGHLDGIKAVAEVGIELADSGVSFSSAAGTAFEIADLTT